MRSDQAATRKPRELLLIFLSASAISCVPVSFDTKSWEMTTPRAERIEGIELSIVLDRTTKGLLGERGRGPWKANLLSRSPTYAKIEVLRARMRSREGMTEVFRGSSILPVQQIRHDGEWTGSWAYEDIPVTVNPQFYPTQKLTIEFDIRINDRRNVTVSKDFQPRHITGTETVNFLTM